MGHWYKRLAMSISKAICLGMLAAGFFLSPAYADDTSAATNDILPAATEAGTPGPAAKHPGLAGWIAPDAVKKMAGWILESGDSHGLPFMIVDKSQAKVFAFGKSGEILGSAWVLVGLAHGDDSVPGIGTMPLAQITPDMRTTPAGRFVATLGNDLGKLNVLWVDYPTAISLHRVINTKKAERRLERIISKAPADHRISYGCINVPAQFFDSVVDPTFKETHGIVYILPEVKEMRAVFPAYYDIDDPGKTQAAVN
jgi:hypothetical protein